jgi:epoxide hydrolase-like predicted phosphatase
MTSADIRAVLFDFAGVVTTPIQQMFLDLAAAAGAEPDALNTLLLGDYGAGGNPWHSIERGEISLADLHEWGLAEGAKHGWNLDLREFVFGLAAADLRPEILAKARELRERGVRTALITNNVRELAETWRARLPVDELFDEVVDSSEVGMRKPEPEIFHLTLKRLGVEPEEAVLLDDMRVNVAAARELGLHAIQVGEHAVDALVELEAMLSPSASPRSRHASTPA